MTEIHCARCGIELTDPDAMLCDSCRKVLAHSEHVFEGRQHVVKHNDQPDLGSVKKRRKHRKSAEETQISINEILKIAEERNISYGKAVALLKGGKL